MKDGLIWTVVHTLIVLVLVIVGGASLGQALAIVPIFYVLLPAVCMLAIAFLAWWAGMRAALVAAVLAAAWIAWGTVVYTGADEEVMEAWGLPAREEWRR